MARRSIFSLSICAVFALHIIAPALPLLPTFAIETANAADPQCSDTVDNDHDGQVDFYDSDCYKDGVYDRTRSESAPVQQQGVKPASTVFMMTINGSHNNAKIYPGQPVTVSWSAPSGYTYCNTGVSPAQPNGWGSYVYKNPSGSEVWWPTVAAMRFQLQCAIDQNHGMEIEDGVASDWIYQCSDGIDNDNDGVIDMNDVSCSSTTDNDETNPKAACQDGADNDNDGLIDFPQDPGCSSKQDNDEFNAPASVTDASIALDIDPQINRGDNLPEKITVRNVGTTNIPGGVVKQTIPSGFTYNPALSNVSCTVAGTLLSCPVGALAPNQSQQLIVYLTVSPSLACNSTVNTLVSFEPTVTDSNPGNNTAGDSFLVTCSAPPPAAQCADGIDNDNDGFVDMNDFSCSSASDNDETNPKAQCQDGADNDGDGVVDSQDPGCVNSQDNDESNAAPTPQCRNEVQQGVLVNNCNSPAGNGLCTNAFYKDITFSQTYSAPPNVLVTINHITESPSCAGGATDKALCYPSNITTTGFRLNCGGSPVNDACGTGTNGYFTMATANWTAVESGAACKAQSGHGIVPQNCSDNQGGLCASGTFSTPITFSTPYASAPNVLVAAENVSNQAGCVGGATDQIECFPSGITTTGFTLNCSGSPYQSCGTSEGFKSLATAGWLATETTNQCRIQSQHLLMTNECPSGVINQTCAGGFRKTVTFPQAFGAAPKVIVSTELTTDSSGVSACAQGASDAYKCEAQNITATGFTAVCWGSPEGAECGAAQEGYTTSAKFGYMAIDGSCAQGNPPPTAQCSDGADNDGDGFIDSNDFSCSSTSDNDETNPKAQCQDGIDNDNDGKVDGQDPGCANTQDNDETNAVTGSADLSLTLNIDPQINKGDNLPVKFTVQNVGTFTVPNAVVTMTVPSGMTFNAGLSNPACSVAGTTLTCNVPTLTSGQSVTFLTYFGTASQACSATIPFQGTVTTSSTTDSNPGNNTSSASVLVTCSNPPPAQCSDGIDNDNDGFVDMNDFSCSSPSDNDETNPKAQCQDGIDNDNDGKVDSQDPGCVNSQDNDESNSVATPQCSDGIDNDNDGFVDMNDFSCSSSSDNDETNPKAQCQDGIDNDNDGKVDSQDPGCVNSQDNDETNAVSCRPIYSGVTTVGFYNGHPHSEFTHVNFPANCANPSVVTQTMVDSVLCGNGGGPITCPNDPQTTSIDLRSYAANISTTGFDVFLSAMDGVWVGATSPAYPISWQATCEGDPMVPACSDGKMFSGIGSTSFYNGYSNSQLGPISIPSSCVNPSLVSQSYITSTLCGDGSGPTTCPNDPATTSQAIMSRVSTTSVFVSGNNGVWVGAVSPQFPVAFQAMCQNDIGSTEKVYGGIANVGWYNGQAQSTLAHVTMPPNCASPTITTQSKYDSILCGNGGGPITCPNDPSTTSADLQSYAVNISSTGFDVFLSAMNGVWVGATSPAYPIAYHITCRSSGTPPPQCSDGIDNDNDGFVDSNDFSCSSSSDNDETNPKAQCQDGIDNDNDGKADAVDPGCVNTQDNDETNPVGTADLAALISLPPQINRGDNLPETLKAQNVGSTTVPSATITQTIPSGFVFNAGLSSSLCSVAGVTVSCAVGTLTAGQTASFLVYLQVPGNYACGTNLSLQDTVTTTTATDGNSANNTAGATTLVTCAGGSSSSSSSSTPADLLATLSIPEQLEPQSDRDLPQTFGISNVGSVTVPSSTITQVIPSGFTFNAGLSNPACTATPTLVTCNVPALVPGQSLSFVVYLDMPTNLACNSTLTMQITANAIGVTDGNLGNNTASDSALITCPSSSSSSSSSSTGTLDLSAGISFDPQVSRSAVFPEKLTASNTGSVNASGVITQNIPAGFVFDGVLSNSACSIAGTTITCTVPTLTPGQTVTYLVYLQAPASYACGAPFSSSDTVTASGDTNVGNNTASASTLVTCP